MRSAMVWMAASVLIFSATLAMSDKVASASGDASFYVLPSGETRTYDDGEGYSRPDPAPVVHDDGEGYSRPDGCGEDSGAEGRCDPASLPPSYYPRNEYGDVSFKLPDGETVMAQPCGTRTWRHDVEKALEHMNELRVRATDGCHTYEFTNALDRSHLGKTSGTVELEIGPANQTWEAGSTISDPGAVGYCQYAAEHQVHGTFKYHFQVDEGTKVRIEFDCTGAAS